MKYLVVGAGDSSGMTWASIFDTLEEAKAFMKSQGQSEMGYEFDIFCLFSINSNNQCLPIDYIWNEL